MDWNNYNTATSSYVRVNWTIATALSSTIMALAMLYIVTEWCLQSHLSTADMGDAARGLYLTRRFRWVTSPFRDAIHYAIEGGYALRKFVLRSRNNHDANESSSASQQHRRSVRWTRHAANRKIKEVQPKIIIPLDDLNPGRPRASSDAPLMEQRDASVSSPSPTAADASSHDALSGGSRSHRSSHEDRTSRELESPTMLHVPGTHLNVTPSPRDRRLSM